MPGPIEISSNNGGHTSHNPRTEVAGKRVQGFSPLERVSDAISGQKPFIQEGLLQGVVSLILDLKRSTSKSNTPKNLNADTFKMHLSHRMPAENTRIMAANVS